MSSPDAPSVLLVLVTYKSERTIGPVVDSVSNWLAADSIRHVSITENSQSADTVAIIESRLANQLDQVVVTTSDFNAGFSPAVNSSVARAEERWGRQDVIILLNPDISEADDALEQVVDFLMADPSIAIASPRLVDAAGRTDRGSMRRPWNKRRLLAEVVGWPALARVLGSTSRNITVPAAQGPVDVAITSGAFMAMRRDAFGAGLDDRLPMYLEDQELCIRAARRGRRVAVLTGCVARHVGGESRKRNLAVEQQLRMMELAKAPAFSLIDAGGATELQVRLVVGLGGMVRGCVAALVLVASVRLRERQGWALEQLTLAKWFLKWAVAGDSFAEVSWRQVAPV